MPIVTHALTTNAHALLNPTTPTPSLQVGNIVKDAANDSTGGVIDYEKFGARFFTPLADPMP